MTNGNRLHVPPGIAALFRRYERAVETMDRDAWAGCWSEDDPVWTLDLGQGVQLLHGKSDIIAAWVDRMAMYREVGFRHTIDEVILIRPDSASVGSETREVLRGIDTSVIHASGRYFDMITYSGDEWLFAARRFVLGERIST